MIFVGFYLIILNNHLIKKVVGLGLLQSGIIVFYILVSYIKNSTAPIIDENIEQIYSNPLPHVLMLTAIVVGIATTALALALVYKIYKAYNTLNEDEINLNIKEND
jgi:multicomponent Na+:H+ antiporter subunit C